MIVLFTDFGLHGPYTGHMKAVLHQMAPGVPVVDLFADAPVGNPKPSAYLLAAYAVWFAAGTGVLGMHRTFILHASGSKLPSDLLGFTCLRAHKREPVQSTRRPVGPISGQCTFTDSLLLLIEFTCAGVTELPSVRYARHC